MRRLFVCLSLMSLSVHALSQDRIVGQLREFRIEGRLSSVIRIGNDRLESADPLTAFGLHLEIAKAHDRIGLHTNTRPVAASLEHIQQAEILARGLGASERAHVQLAYAEYFYRAEMKERIFDVATRYANAALAACEEMEDTHCQADAVHRLGLIHLQRRELDEALRLFEESLRLDQIDDERLLLRADYERHVGFVYSLREDYKTALGYFMRSLDYRLEAEAVDAAMFAMISVAAVLAELGRDQHAMVYVQAAEKTAEKLDSDTGRARLASIRERISE